jgi:hypothetical protein
MYPAEVPVSSHTTTSGQASDVNKGFFELIIATIPTVLLYFVGWAYLYFYLNVFDVGISELDLEIQTIFIYSFPPIRTFLGLYWVWIAIGILVVSISIALARRFANEAVKKRLSALWKRIRGASPIAQGLGLFAALLFLAILAVPIIRSEAVEAASQKWLTEGVRIEAMVKPLEAKEQSPWYDNYEQCANRRALDLIFADKDAYYILCKSTVDERSAIVFEVRRDVGLTSIRFVQREY